MLVKWHWLAIAAAAVVLYWLWRNKRLALPSGVFPVAGTGPTFSAPPPGLPQPPVMPATTSMPPVGSLLGGAPLRVPIYWLPPGTVAE